MTQVALTTAIRCSNVISILGARIRFACICAISTTPCVGDPLYGRGGKYAEKADRGLTRQFLHSWRVAFTHPVTGETIECRDELPWDLAAVLDELAPVSLGRTAAGEEIVPQLGLQ